MLIVAIVIIAFLFFIGFVWATWLDHKAKKNSNDKALKEATEILRRNEEKSFKQSIERMNKEDGFTLVQFLIVMGAALLALALITTIYKSETEKKQETQKPLYEEGNLGEY